ncbi:MAG TPA: phosphotransferase, partial [Phototrophicaceae bacterium]|nr:phosphotransferase [Phototrophicaceae bacterium]
ERLAAVLQTQSLELVLCHSDAHAGNLFIDATSDALYLVDWDNPILAPVERDLMFVGGGQGGGWHTPEEEERLFYQGYGQIEVNPVALAYYLYERIIQDISAYSEQLLLTAEGGADRAVALKYLTGNFLSGSTLEIAFRSERHLPQELRLR